MYILFFDTETTGKPTDYKAPMSHVHCWPRLVQLGYISMADGEVVAQEEYVIKPFGFEIPAEASKIHGITQERAMHDGIIVELAIVRFMRHLAHADVIVGHNVSFDVNVVGAEYWRIYGKNPFGGMKIVDTMTSATEFCQIPGPYGYKWPKLTELWFKLFGTELPQAHTALDDIQNTAKCFFELEKRGVIKIGEEWPSTQQK